LASKKLVVQSALLAFCGLSLVPLSRAAAEGNCDDATAQSRNLRIDREKNAWAIQVLGKSAQWRVVFRSVVEVNLARQSPDNNFLAYASSERGTPWLYLQRLSTGAREPVAQLESKPAELCFDSTASVIYVISTSGAVTSYDISPQLRLMPGR
jgi:hypothetical protein